MPRWKYYARETDQKHSGLVTKAVDIEIGFEACEAAHPEGEE